MDRFPKFDSHHVLRRSYPAQHDGLPLDSSTLDELHALGEEPEVALGMGGIHVGDETHAGARRFHVYSDGEDQNVDAVLSEFASSHDMSLEPGPDPARTEVRHLTGRPFPRSIASISRAA